MQVCIVVVSWGWFLLCLLRVLVVVCVLSNTCTTPSMCPPTQRNTPPQSTSGLVGHLIVTQASSPPTASTRHPPPPTASWPHSHGTASSSMPPRRAPSTHWIHARAPWHGRCTIPPIMAPFARLRPTPAVPMHGCSQARCLAVHACGTVDSPSHCQPGRCPTGAAWTA